MSASARILYFVSSLFYHCLKCAFHKVCSWALVTARIGVTYPSTSVFSLHCQHGDVSTQVTPMFLKLGYDDSNENIVVMCLMIEQLLRQGVPENKGRA
jgi:hypothetical protein